MADIRPAEDPVLILLRGTEYMEFNGMSFVIIATDEKESLIKTVENLVALCPPEDLGEIIITVPAKVTAEFEATVSCLENAYPGTVRKLVQTLPFIGGAVRDGGCSVKTSHFMLFTADLAIGFESLPEMIECSKKHPDAVVKTSRWMQKNSFDDSYSALRKAINGLAQLFLRVLFCSGIRDMTNPGQIMPAKLFRSIDWKELKFSFMEEMVLVPVRLGTEFFEFPASCRGRKEGISKNSFWQTADYLRTAFRVRFTPKKRLIK